MDSLRPSPRTHHHEQAIRKGAENSFREIGVGDEVLTLDFRTAGQNKLTEGRINKAKGNTNFEVQLRNGDVVHQHIDQLVKRIKAVSEESLLVEDVTSEVESSDNSPPSQGALEVPEHIVETTSEVPALPEIAVGASTKMESSLPAERRASSRVRRKPDRLEF